MYFFYFLETRMKCNEIYLIFSNFEYEVTDKFNGFGFICLGFIIRAY